MLAVSIFSRGPWSWPIRAAQAFGAFGHVASMRANFSTVEALAVPGRVVERDVGDLLDRSTFVEALALEVTPEQALAREQFLAACVGQRYDYLGAVGAWAAVRQWQDTDRLFCSEADALAWQHAGVLKLSPYLRGVMPMQLHYLLTAAGAKRLSTPALERGLLRPE